MEPENACIPTCNPPDLVCRCQSCWPIGSTTSAVTAAEQSPGMGTQPHQVVLGAEHVHGAALAPADAGLLAKELRHDFSCRHILAERVHMVAVRGADVVVPPQVPDHARGDRL